MHGGLATYDFGSVPLGSTVSHAFTLTNISGKPLTIDRIRSICSCLTSVVAAKSSRRSTSVRLPFTLAQGATLTNSARLDTSKLPDITSATPAGSQVSKQILVYANGDKVHPAIVLEMRGRLTVGVAFDTPLLDFGTVPEAAGGERRIKVTYDPAWYVPGKTRLAIRGDDGVVVDGLVDATASSGPGRSGDATSELRGSPQTLGGTRRDTASGAPASIVRYYIVKVPPRTPAGPLSGTLEVEGLASPPGPHGPAGKSPATVPYAPTGKLAYVGRVSGTVTAEPAMALFGAVQTSMDSAAAPVAIGLDGRKRRTRWILLIGAHTQPAVPVGPGPVRGIEPPGEFWRDATVTVGRSEYQAALVLPSLTPAPAAPGGEPGPPPVPKVLSGRTACWLRVTVTPPAAEGPLNANVIVTLRSGERVRVPVYGQGVKSRE